MCSWPTWRESTTAGRERASCSSGSFTPSLPSPSSSKDECVGRIFFGSLCLQWMNTGLPVTGKTNKQTIQYTYFKGDSPDGILRIGTFFFVRWASRSKYSSEIQDKNNIVNWCNFKVWDVNINFHFNFFVWRETWEKKPILVQRKNPDYYKGLFSTTELDRILREVRQLLFIYSFFSNVRKLF